MTQLQMFDTPPPAAVVDTRLEAAQAIKPALRKLQQLVLDAIVRSRHYGATDHELVAALGMLPDTLRARRVELKDRGLIRDSGRRRKTPRGRQAVVWIASAD
jgi:hypothetical protein